MNPWLVVAAVVLEFGSCLSFVIVFRLFFAPVAAAAARELAWTQTGSGALLPGGGVGSLAVGWWLLHLTGMPTRQIVQRSSGLFFLTSAVNVVTLSAAGLLLLLGIADGAHDVLRAGIPAVTGVGACGLALGLPALTRRISGAHPRAAWLDDIGSGIPAARHALARPSWRLVGALGYLLFDIAVLWTTFAAVGPLPPLAPLVLAYLAGYLANAIPVPGGIGVLDAGLVGALALYGLPVTHAAAAVLVYHAIAFWIPTLGGTAGYVRLRRRLTVGDGQRPLRVGPVPNRQSSYSAAPASPAAAATSSALPAATTPSGNTSTSSRPTRTSIPAATAADSTSHVRGPEPCHS